MDSLSNLKLRASLYFPKSVLARLGLLLAAITVPMYLLGRFIPSLGRQVWFSPSLSFLIWFLSVVLLLLLYRWLRQNLMWRLRNRLVVTYIFIGVIPVLLLIAMAGVAGYLFAGQFATFVVTQDISEELQRLEASNAMLATEISARAQDPKFSTDDIVRAAHERLGKEFPGRSITAYVGKKVVVVGSEAQQQPLEIPEYARQTPSFKSLVLDDDNRIYLRAVNTVDHHGEEGAKLMRPQGAENLGEGVDYRPHRSKYGGVHKKVPSPSECLLDVQVTQLKAGG